MSWDSNNNTPPAGFQGVGYSPLGVGPMMGGARYRYSGMGGSVFAVWLMAVLVPSMIVSAVGLMPATGLIVAAFHDSIHRPDPALLSLAGLLSLVTIVAIIGVSLVGGHKLTKYYWDNVTIEGKRCVYHGTVGGLISAMVVPLLLTSITMGLYAPWFACQLRSWIFSQVDVSGERLQFNGDGGGLLGTWLIGSLLSGLTFGIYIPWHHNNMLEYFWTNTSISGRSFRFQKDPGGYFGVWLLNLVLRTCTGGLYYPWSLSNQWDWEAKHIG